MNDNTQPGDSGNDSTDTQTGGGLPSPDRRTFIQGLGASAGATAMSGQVAAQTNDTNTTDSGSTDTSNEEASIVDMALTAGTLPAMLVAGVGANIWNRLTGGNEDEVKDITSASKQEEINSNASQLVSNESEWIENDRPPYGEGQTLEDIIITNKVSATQPVPKDSKAYYAIRTRIDNVIGDGLQRDQSESEIIDRAEQAIVQYATDFEKELIQTWNYYADIEWGLHYVSWKWYQDGDSMTDLDVHPTSDVYFDYIKSFGVWGNTVDALPNEPAIEDIRPTVVHTLADGSEIEVTPRVYYDSDNGDVRFKLPFSTLGWEGINDKLEHVMNMYSRNITEIFGSGDTKLQRDYPVDYYIEKNGQNSVIDEYNSSGRSHEYYFVDTGSQYESSDYGHHLQYYAVVRNLIENTLRDEMNSLPDYVSNLWQKKQDGEIDGDEMTSYRSQAQNTSSDLGRRALRMSMLGFSGSLDDTVEVTINRGDGSTQSVSGHMFLDIPKGQLRRPITNVYNGQSVAVTDNDYVISQIRNLDGYSGEVPVTIDITVTKSDGTEKTYTDIQTTVVQDSDGPFVTTIPNVVDSVSDGELALQKDGFVTFKNIGEDGETIEHVVTESTDISFGTLPDSVDRTAVSNGETDYVVAGRMRIITTENGEEVQYNAAGDDVVNVDTVYKSDGSGSGGELTYTSRIMPAVNGGADAWAQWMDHKEEKDTVREEYTQESVFGGGLFGDLKSQIGDLAYYALYAVGGTTLVYVIAQAAEE